MLFSCRLSQTVFNMPRLSIEERGRALGLVEAGVSQRQVAALLNCSQATISRLVDRHRRTGSARDGQRTGAPRLTTPAVDRYIVNTHLRNRFLPAAVTARGIPGRHGNISERTIRRRLNAGGLSCRRPHVGPQLTRERRQVRLQWSNQHLRWRLQQWDGVAFSDESRFCVSHVDGRTRIWRRRGERFADCCITETDRWGGGSVMVWGAISAQHRSELHVFDGPVNAQVYRRDILENHVVPLFEGHPDLHTFQQDNARAHTARACTLFLQQQNFDLLPWPPYSPDLSPIEHLWDTLGQRINAQQVLNVGELRAALVREWDNIDQQIITNLTRSMRRRIRACIGAAGGHIPY